jgi:hypothetical protein
VERVLFLLPCGGLARRRLRWGFRDAAGKACYHLFHGQKRVFPFRSWQHRASTVTCLLTMDSFQNSHFVFHFST